MPSPLRDDRHLFGLPGAEGMYFSVGEVYQRCIEPYIDGSDRRPWMVEEWSVRPPIQMLTGHETVLEHISEFSGENCELTEEGANDIDLVMLDPEVVEATKDLLRLIASKIEYRMAETKIADHLIEWDLAGQPLLDGVRFYPPPPIKESHEEV